MTVSVEIYLTSAPGERPDDAFSHTYDLPDGVVPCEGDQISIMGSSASVQDTVLGRVRKVTHLMGDGFYKIHVCVDPISSEEFHENYKD